MLGRPSHEPAQPDERLPAPPEEHGWSHLLWIDHEEPPIRGLRILAFHSEAISPGLEPPLSRKLRTSEDDDRVPSRQTRLLPLPKFDRPQLITHRVTYAKRDDSRNPYNSE